MCTGSVPHGQTPCAWDQFHLGHVPGLPAKWLLILGGTHSGKGQKCLWQALLSFGGGHYTASGLLALVGSPLNLKKLKVAVTRFRGEGPVGGACTALHW